MSSPSPSLRKRAGKKDPSAAGDAGQRKTAPKQRSEWDYRLALTVITVLAFITRFYKISHPAEVVFDEVHFGKVSTSCLNCSEIGLTGFPSHSLHPIICSGPTSSTCILRLASSFLG